jgi:cell division protease FtsH
LKSVPITSPSKPPQTPTGTQATPPEPNPLKRWSWWLSFLVILLVNFFLISTLTPGPSQRTEVSYTFFRQQVLAGNVADISSRADTIQGTFRQAVPYPADQAGQPVTNFSTVRPAFADPGLETLLDQQNVTINAKPIDEPANPLLNLLLSFGPTVLLIGGFIWISRRASGAMGGGGFSAWARARPNATTRRRLASA